MARIARDKWVTLPAGTTRIRITKAGAVQAAGRGAAKTTARKRKRQATPKRRAVKRKPARPNSRGKTAWARQYDPRARRSRISATVWKRKPKRNPKRKAETKTFSFYWAPTGAKIADIAASSKTAAKTQLYRQYPQYKRAKGEVYFTTNPAKGKRRANRRTACA